MNKAQMASVGIAFVLAIDFISHAQTTTRAVQSSTANLDVMAILDQARALAEEEPVLEQSIPVRATGTTEELPPGTYWSLTDNQPPMPFDQFPELPVYVIDAANGIFVLDDRSVDWIGLQAQQAEQTQTKAMAGTMMTMDEPDPGDGGDGDTNSYNGGFTPLVMPNYGTNLWIANFALNVPTCKVAV